MKPPVAVIGAGAWGTALALVLASQGRRVRLWEYFQDYADVLNNTRENPKFLPGVRIPDAITVTHRLDQALSGSAAAVLAVPSQRLRSVVRQMAALPERPDLWISAAKGIEQESLCRMSEVVHEELGPAARVGVLSGPSHAEEVGRGLPCSLVAAAQEESTAATIQDLFITDVFRVYTSLDLVGVELGGSLKNVIALAAGVSDGMGLGDNAKAALLTRGLAEITRLGKALGSDPMTFAGLSGMGDLVVTCTSQHSRNRRVGEALGRGQTLETILSQMEMVAEGVATTRSAKALGEKMGVELPITQQVYRILFDNISAGEALKALMLRPRKSEIELS